jgi:2-C-methyl-D-erythritol 4-phosphate cytidylyltransferase
MAHADYAIVPAAGTGSRFGGETPKQYQLLAGRPLIYHSLSALCRCQRIERVWVVLSSQTIAGGGSTIGQASAANSKPFSVAAQTRSASVANGLRAAATAAADEDWVLVHDAARPCLSQAMLTPFARNLPTIRSAGCLPCRWRIR